MFLLVAWVLVCVAQTACSRKETAQRPTSVSVKTMTVAASTHVVGKSYMGTVEEEDGANVSFGVLGNVVKVMVAEGQFVRKGQPLAEVDGVNVRNAHEISASTLKQAEDAYKRLKDLYDKGTLPEIKMVEMETQLAKARAAEAISRKSVDEIVLRAPFDAFVATASVHVGASVVPGMTGFRLVKIDRVKVRLSVPEKEVGQVQTGQQVTFTVDALGDSVFKAKVLTRGVTANPVSHAYDVKAVTDNRRHLLLPGMVCKVHLENTGGDYTIVVPQNAVQISGREKYVWLVKEGKALRQDVVTGDVVNEGVVIDAGLTTGDVIVVSGQSKVCEGIEVRSEE